jgi:uncharacterized membrane protein
VPNQEVVVHRRPEAAAAIEAGSTQNFVAVATTLGVVAAGVALFEAALLPAMVIGGAAVLVPGAVPMLRRRLGPLFSSTGRDHSEARPPSASKTGFGVKQAVVKTITYRLIVTTLDFTTNYVVIGEFATAAGLSTFALVAGPLFYFAHETAWNYFGSPISREGGRWGTNIDLSIPLLPKSDPEAPLANQGRFTINRAVAKTITFRTIATTMDFAANYVVIGELATAVALTAVGFVFGPFVYLGHEMAWDRFGSPKEQTNGQANAPAT